MVFTSWELLNRIIIPFIPCRDHTGSIYIPIYIVFLWKKYEDVAKYIIHGYNRYVRNLFFRAFFRKASEKSTPFSNQLNSFPPEIHLKRPWAPPLNSEMILIPSVWNEENTGPTFHGKFVRKSIDSTVTFHGILLMVQKSCIYQLRERERWLKSHYLQGFSTIQNGGFPAGLAPWPGTPNPQPGWPCSLLNDEQRVATFGGGWAPTR